LREGPVAIIGAGAFGAALAVAFAGGGTDVVLLGRDAEAAARMAAARKAARGGAALPERVTPTADPALLADAAIALIATPAQTTRAVLAQHNPLIAADAPLVLCAKGLEKGSLARQSEIAAEVAPGRPVAVLTGPSFADEISLGLPTAITLACADLELGRAAQERLAAPMLRLYLTDDVVGAEMGGALKNVIAIACGAAVGRGLGESARAALMTRGFAELTRIAAAMGGRPETMAGLSGLGDLALTCASEKSRNFAYGLALGRGRTPAEIAADGRTYEGAATAEVAVSLARKLGVEAPICAVVADLVAGRCDMEGAIASLLARPLKRESWSGKAERK